MFSAAPFTLVRQASREMRGNCAVIGQSRARLMLAVILGLALLSPTSMNSPKAQGAYDATGATFSLTNSKLSFLDGRSKTTADSGTVAIYTDAASIQGLDIDVVVRVTNVPSGTSIQEMDCGSGSTLPNGGLGTRCAGSGVTDSYWDLLTTGLGDFTFTFSLFEAGTYTGAGTGIPVVVNNLSVSTLDIDGTQSARFFGFQRYKLYQTPSNEASILTVSNDGNGKTKFLSSNTGLDGFNNCRGIAEVEFDNVSSFGFDTRSGTGGGVAGFLLVLGPTGLTCNAQTTANNPANRAPTSTDASVTLRVANGSAHTLEKANFGGYQDLDNNPLEKIQLSTLPANANIQRRQSDGSWSNLTAGAEFTVEDIDQGLIRISSVSASTSFRFFVNDGIVNSASTYELSVIRVTSTQTVTFTNPGTRNSGVTFSSGATASSGLTVTLTSNTTGVCTVSGLNVTTIAIGTCSITASQAGDSTYATAQSVTQVFSVSTKTNQNITFPAIADQIYAGTNVTISSNATSDSGLLVGLSTSTGDVCSISSLNIVVIGTGTCIVKARQEGNATYAAAELTRSFFVTDGTTPVDTTPPTITSSDSLTVLENQRSITTLTADETVSWSIIGGADSASVLVDTSTGVIEFVDDPDFEVKSVYFIVVEAEDLVNLIDSMTIRINISDVFESGAVSWASISGDIRKGGSVNLSALSNAAGTLSFFEKGRLISGCKAKPSSGNSPVFCNWKPRIHGTLLLTVTFTPTNSSTSSAASRGAIVTVLKRAGSR